MTNEEKANEQSALWEYIDKHFNEIQLYARHIARRVAPRIDPEELANETVRRLLELEATKPPPFFSDSGRFKHLIYGVMTNVSREMFRRELRQPQGSDIIEEFVAADQTLQDVIEREEKERLAQAISSLSPIERETLWAAMMGYPYHELAEKYGISVSAMRQRLHRVRKQILANLNEKLKD